MGRAYRILLIEGHLPDAVLIERALAPAADVQLRVAYGGDAARQVLQRHPPFEGCRMPDLILLDADLPDGESDDLLAELACTPSLQRVPVLLLRSADAAWVAQPVAYSLYTAGMLTRPSGLNAAQRFVSALRQHWCPPSRAAAEL